MIDRGDAPWHKTCHQEQQRSYVSKDTCLGRSTMGNLLYSYILAFGLMCTIGCSGGSSQDTDASADAGDSDADFSAGDADLSTFDADEESDGDVADEADVDVDDGSTVEQQSGLEIDIVAGRVHGEEEGGLRRFLGIPFAEAPVGDLRFRPPVPVAPWEGTLEANAYGPSCPQGELGPEFLLGDFAGPQSEDCLSLNVWAYDDGRVRPVMVFIYGGGFVCGAASWPLYDGAELARGGDVVVVNINYRLGALGYLATEALAEEGAGSSGNYGLRDQMEALRWVQSNILAFGGDPENVTVFGESAGAISVCSLFGVPEADGLYHKAIMESGMCSLTETEQAGGMSTSSAFEMGANAVDAVGCSDATDELACLREVPVEELVALSSFTELLGGDATNIELMGPTVDGTLVVEQPLERIARGEADVPLIVGSNEAEGLLFAGMDLILTRDALRDKIADAVGDEAVAADIAMLYPASQYLFPRDAYIAFLSDISFICPGIELAGAAASGQPSFNYYFTRAPILIRPMGAIHSIELVYLFETFNAMFIAPTASDRNVADILQRSWGGFAYHGSPPLETGWPPFESENPSIAILNDPPSITDEIRNGRCAALQDLGATW